MPKLAVISGDVEEREFRFEAAIVLGRSPDCEVTIPGALVSRRHAQIAPDSDEWFLEDLGSANGTVVNGQQVERVRLQRRRLAEHRRLPAHLRPRRRLRGPAASPC